MQMERQEWRLNEVRICAEVITVRKLKQSIFHGICEVIITDENGLFNTLRLAFFT